MARSKRVGGVEVSVALAHQLAQAKAYGERMAELLNEEKAKVRALEVVIIRAMREEVRESMASGFPALYATCDLDANPVNCRRALDETFARAQVLLPAA